CRFYEFNAAGSVKHGGVRKKIGRKLCPRPAGLDGDSKLGVEARPSIDAGLRASARLPVETAGCGAHARALAANNRLGGGVQPFEVEDFWSLHVPVEPGLVAAYSEPDDTIGTCGSLRHKQRSRHCVVIAHVHEGGVIERLVSTADKQLGS